MWALTDYYTNLFSYLVAKDGEGWFVSLAGQDLPWESADNLHGMGRKDSKGSSQGSMTSAVDKHEHDVGNLGLGIGSIHQLDKWLALDPRVESVQPLQSIYTSGSKSSGSSSTSSSSSSSGSKISGSSSGSSSPGSTARKRRAQDKNSAGLLGLWESLSGSTGGSDDRRAQRRVTFSTTAQCVLIPSRGDLRAQGLHELLWFPDEDLEAAKREAQSELQGTLSSNSSSLSLYAAMSLLYRPCMKGSNHRRDHFRILIVDDSTVARRMLIHNIVTGHRQSGTQEHLYVHQADSLPAAIDSIHMHTYNLICVDQFLNGDDDRALGGQGHSIIKQARKQFDDCGCIIIGMSAALDLPGESTELGRATAKAMMEAGADVIFRKPLPVNMWQQLVHLQPVEF